MKLLLGACAAMAATSVQAQTTQTVPVTITIPAPVPGPMGPPGPAGTSPSVAAIEAALAADPNFVKSVAAKVGGVTPPPLPPPTAAIPTCTATSGTLTLNAKVSRSTGISPLTVWFDGTGTTDSAILGNTTPFQDVQYSFVFGDSGVSGLSPWTYGSNPGKSRNSTVGAGLAAHLYVASADTTYPVTVSATDGTNSATCQLAVTVYDPSGTNGFAGTATTCVAAASTPVAAQGGCPAGAAVLSQVSYSTALGGSAFGSGKRVLFKCGDTFTTSGGVTLAAVKWAIDAYGGCENSTTNRPIFRTTGGTPIVFSSKTTAMGDGRIANIDFDGGGSSFAILQQGGAGTHVNYQITVNNVNARNGSGLLQTGASAQFGLFNSTMHGMQQIGVYFNAGGFDTSLWPGSVFANLNYQALIGNSLDGVGARSGCNGIETFRISAAPYFVASNNDIQNANSCGPVFKVHQSNPNSTVPWIGQYSQYIEVSDNKFFGTSGGQLVEFAPQNDSFDERLRNIVVERNLMVTANATGEGLMVSAQYATVRNNVVWVPAGQASPDYYLIHVGTRGAAFAYPTSFVQVYNNTCYVQSTKPGQICVNLSGGVPMEAPPIGTVVKNNLMFDSLAAGTKVVSDVGTASIISNNTANPTLDPAMRNASGSLATLGDFTPTANYADGVKVPVWTDAIGNTWAPLWDLGALHH